MKQHQRISQRTTAQRTLFPIDQQQTSRRTMNRWLRTSLLLVFTLLVVAFLAAALIAWRPFIFNWQMRMIETSMTSEADYAVHLKDNAIDSIQIAPADAVYLDELVDAVEPPFRVHFTADRTVTGTARTTINAILQAPARRSSRLSCEPSRLYSILLLLKSLVWPIMSLIRRSMSIWIPLGSRSQPFAAGSIKR